MHLAVGALLLAIMSVLRGSFARARSVSNKHWDELSRKTTQPGAHLYNPFVLDRETDQYKQNGRGAQRSGCSSKREVFTVRIGDRPFVSREARDGEKRCIYAAEV